MYLKHPRRQCIKKLYTVSKTLMYNLISVSSDVSKLRLAIIIIAHFHITVRITPDSQSRTPDARSRNTLRLPE